MVYESVSITTAADGSATATTDSIFKGRLLRVTVTGPLSGAGTTDITIKGATSGVTYFTSTNLDAVDGCPILIGLNHTSGAAYAGAGIPVPLVQAEKLTITVAQGGNAQAGTVELLSSE